MSEQADYIIVGAGAAGSVLADRLSADGRSTVLVLESGGSDLDPMIAIPKGFFFLSSGNRHSFMYDTEPTGPEHVRERWQRGRVDGGSTSINGLQYERGNRPYWDALERSGLEGWGWNTILPLFLSLENHELGASPERGAGGPLDIRVTREPDELTEAMFAALEDYGLPRVPDINAAEGPRAGYLPNTVRRGRRRSAATAFLDPARRRPNVAYLRHAHVSTVRFDGRRAVGVQARTRGVLRDYRAAREVIICAGGIETPQLLERSGIGAGEVLARIGVAPIVENPHVGEHLIEQRHIVYQAHIDRRLGVNHRLSSRFRQLLAGAGYLLTRRGVIAGGVYDIGGFARLGPGYLGPSRLDPAGLDPASTDPASTDPDTFVMMNPLSMDLASPTPAVSKRPGFRLGAFLLSPETEGSLHSGGAQPDAAPVIEPRYLEAEWERETTRRMIEAARDIASRHPLAELFVEEDAPGADVVTTEQAVAHAWANRALSHAVGTARMAADGAGVVDATLRVTGIEGLRIADTSVLPKQPGNTMAPTYGLAARAAELILADR